MSSEYISFRPNVTVIYDHDSESFRMVVDWDEAYQGPYDEDGEREPIGDEAGEFLEALIAENPILSGTSHAAVPWSIAEGVAAPVEPVKPPQPFLTCKHFCPSSEQPDLAGPRNFEFDQRFPFPNCSNRAVMPNGFGPCRAYGRNMPSCSEYQAEEPMPVKLITNGDGKKTLVSTARVGLGTTATILGDPDEPDVFSRYDGTTEEAVANLLNLGADRVASEPEVDKRPSFLATLVGAAHAQR